MSEIFHYKLGKLFNALAGTADNNSDSVNCLGHSHARISSTTSSTFVDAGGIDQTVQLQGSIDGTNYDTVIAGTTHTAASETKTSAVIDIRGYSRVRLVYTHNGCTAGTIDATLNTLIG